MINKWRNMSTADRRRTQILIGFLILAIYMPMYYISSDKLFEAQRMLNRRKDRIEKRINYKDIDTGGITVKAMQNRVDEVDKKIKQASQTLAQINSHFAPVESTDLQRQIMLEISAAAERTGAHLVAISPRRVARGDDSITRANIDPVTGRPMLDLTLNARFGALLQFLNALNELSYHVAVMHVKLEAPQLPRDRSATQVDPSLLQIQLIVSE
ncbi:MAG: hypothetical protein ACF8OB_14600 [Phycisphaeraceae bacterium JB051]